MRLFQHKYTYILPNGTEITSDSEKPNIQKSGEESIAKDTVLLGTTPTSTSTTTMPDYDGPGK